MEKNNKLLILFILGLVFVLVIVANNNVQVNSENTEIKLSNGQMPVLFPIFINDTDPNLSWSKFAENYTWCSGSGTWEDPYLIDNIIIDGHGTAQYCIKIVNSNQPFIINNSICHSTDYDGILLENVTNAYLINNTCYSNIFGIRLYNSRNNTVSNNILYDNVGESGSITLDYSDNNTISNNMGYDNGIGVLVYKSSSNIICKNQFERNQYGIDILSGSRYNSISNNLLTSFYSGAIELSSSNNSILNNIIDGMDYSPISYCHGIGLRVSHNNSIKFNNMKRCGETGIKLGTSYDNSILYNTIIGDESCISGSLSGNIIENNNLHWLDLPPLLIDDSDQLKSWEHYATNYDWCSGNVGDGFRIENVTINGNNTESCIEIKNSYVKFEIKNSNLFNSGPGTMMAAITLINTTRGILTENNCSLNNARGIYLYNTNQTKVIGNTINDNFLEGICVEKAINVFIENNTVENNRREGIELHIGHENEILNNKLNSNYVGILVHGNNYNNMVMGNEIKQSYNGIRTIWGEYNTISGNNISGSTHFGISLESPGGYHYVWHNNLNDNANGIIISHSDGNDISGNIIKRSKFAIDISESEYNDIYYNQIITNGYGIRSYGGEHNNIFDNIIFENVYGIYLEHRCNNNTIKNNSITSNENGLIIEGYSNFNLIHDNEFIGNGLNAEDNSYDLVPISYHKNYAYQILDFRGLLWGTAFPRVVADASLIDNALSSKDNYNLFLEADYPYYIPPDWLHIDWGNYDNFDSITHQYLSKIEIDYRVMTEGGWLPNVLDQASDLTLFVVADNGDYQSITVASTPVNAYYYDNVWTITSGPVYDRVLQGGYIEWMALYMYCWEPVLTIIWMNIDYIEISYYTSIPVQSNNQWDNGTIGNSYDDYIGEDLDDDGIGDDPYTISGTAETIDHYPIFSDKLELTMEIIPNFIECYMGDDVDFSIALTLDNFFGKEVNLPLDIIEEKAYWDAHSWVRTHFTSFTNYSGIVFHNETGIPLATLKDIYLLNSTLYPNASLIVAPEILEYDPNTDYSRQKIEIYFQLDLDYLFSLYDLELKDISYINATLFGAHFLESAYININNIIESFGRIEVYNYKTDSYITYLDYLFEETFELGNPNNPLNLLNIPDYSFDFTADNLSQYVDPNNVITFRFFSYFEGYLKDAQNSYLSNFESNAVIGTWLDYIGFDVVWWEETPKIIYYNNTKMINSDSTYTYSPTCPGNYTIFFEVIENPTYKSVNGNFTIEVKRRPVDLNLSLATQAYTTDNLDIVANVTDLFTGAPAIRAKVNFYSDYYGNITLLGTSLTDAHGIASITVTNLFQGDYFIFAKVEENYGQLSEPFRDEPFYFDIWAEKKSEMYSLHIDLTPTSIELLSLAPEGFDVIVNQNLYIYSRLINENTGFEIYFESISISDNFIPIGVYNSSTPILISFSTPGEHLIRCRFNVSDLFESSETAIVFNVTRLKLSIKEISPSESIYYINQEVAITILAKDLSTNMPIEGLNIFLCTNQTGEFMEFLSGITNSEGLATFIFDIPENWASKTVKYYAYNSPKLGFCLQRKTNVSSITIRPLYTRIIFSVDKTDLYVNENYTFNFELLNDDLQKLIENAQLIITISNETYYEQFEVITSYNSSLNLKFLTAGLYYIEIDYYGSSLYLECHDYYTIEILKRPTYFSIDVTEMDLVPGNNFSITVNLFDAFTNESIQNKWISVFENIYDNGSLVEDKFLFDVLIPLTNTFSWKPLREADFEFVFHFVSNDDIYQDSYYSLILNVSKRQVLIEPSIQNFDYKIDEFVRFNTTFTDLNTTNSDPIPGLLVHYLILDGENIIYSQNHTTNEEGIIEFEWQIPSSLINKNLTILIITEESNYYQSYFNEIKITTAPLKTYFNIIITPNPHSYINEDIIIEIEFLTTRGEKVEDEITYEITCEDLSYYESSVINLSETSLLTKSFSEAGKYIYKFYYLGSELYAPTEKEIVYFIELYPSKLNLIDYPEYIYPEEDTINLIYQLIDTFNQQSISGSLVKLFYIDFTTSTKIFLNSLTTDLDGKVNFLVSLPEAYAESSIIFIAETNQTTLNEGASNSVELLITESPTYIDFAALTDSYQYYIDENLNITFELYDYFDNLLITETLYLEIETPTNYLTLQISCNQTIQFNFTELGLYRINASYSGSSLYLPTYTQIYYGVSPIPTSLEFTEKIPEILYSDEHLFLRARLENNLTGMPIKDEIVKFFITNSTSKYLIYEGITDNEGLISCIWDIEPKFIGQEVNISAVYDYADYYNNCSTPKISTFISKYNVELNLVEFPDSLSPFLEEQFIIEVFKLIIPSDVASNCHIQLSLLLPNGTRIIIKDGFTDNFGVIEFSWTPYRDIFEFNNAIFEIYVIDDDQYYGGFILTKEISIDKLQTSISIIPEKFQVLPGELVIIHFDLIDIYERELLGQIINVKIENPLFLTSFKIEIGFNNSYEFLIPNYGAFEIIGSYEGTDRYYPSSNETEIYSEKFELEIDLSILEAFSVVESTDFLGTYLNYSILDFNNNLTLVANVTIKDYDIPYEDAEVSFFFLQKNKEPILIGSNITNKEGIAIFNWDTSNYTTTNWWKNTAILAKIDETEYNYAAESNPIYFNLRKIKTSLELELFTSKFRIDINYDINITLYDEFLIALKGYNLSVDIYFKGKITQSYEIVTNDTTFFNFTPTKLGNYIIKVYFAGTEEYKESQLTEEHKCVEKEPTNIQTNLPEYIRPGELYSINVILFNSTGGLLIGELVAIQIICHDESGSTEYFYLDLIIGDNNTFDWIFPEYDEYIIKATYKGTDDYLGCKVNFKAQSIFTFSLSFWETFFIILVPALMITPSFNFKIKTSKGKRRKKIFLVIFLVITILFSSYSGIALICSQTERTGLIKDLKAISNYYPEDPLTQNQDTMNDLYDYGGSTLEKINPEWIPNLENDTESYDLVLENSTIIPPELDMNPPRLWFSEISNGDILREKTTIKLGVFDRESGVHEVLFKLLYQGITLVKEDFFYYDPISDLYIYNLSTTDYVDGEYVIYALAIDNNNNNNTASVEIRIVNNPIYDVDPTEYENVKAELTDYINISFTSIANGTYNLKILDLNYKTIIKMSDSITTEKMNTLEILIDPLFFKASDYIILITILMLNVLGIVVKETKELNLQVLKESVKLEIDIMEDDNIYSNHLINVKARLVENDKYLSESDELIEIEPKTPIPGQVLTFEMGDRDNPQTLGTTVTDINGYATFNYNVSVAKGQHIFNVTFQGNNIYQPIEEMKLFKNKGKYMNIQLVYVSNNIPYNEIGNISAVLLADEKRLSNQTLYFNISNSENNYYLGMASTDTNGEAKLLFPCDYAPGEYDIIVSYDGKSIYADNVSIFKGKLNITLQDVALSIQTGMGSDIHCPYYYNTSLVANLLEDDTNNGIEDIMVTFEAILFPSGTKYPIGSSLTDPNGLASINFNPSLISNLIPGNYILNVNTSGNDFYKESSDTANLIISKDIPIISIQGTETLFHTEFQINATLTDSQLNPIQGAALNFYIINSSKSPEEILYNGKAETNSNGTATLKVQPEEFPYLGKFDIFVFFDGMQNLIYDSTSNMVKYGLQVFQHTTLLLIQGPEKGNVIDPYEIDLFLLDKEGTPITGQKVLIECYKEGGITNLLRPNTHVITDNLYGNATFSLNITVPGTFIIKALYLPLFDDDVYNNGYLSSQSEIRFIIERVPADLSITKINLPRIMRGDIFKFTVETGLEEAKREDIPINIFVDIDLNGDGIKHDDIFRGKYFFIENGTGVIAYNIPVDDTFQAGQHKFTVVIDEEWSSFTGSTSFLIDFIERTTLEIKYHFLNPNASGRHYLWEEEQIEFILRDEDGDPLPYSCNIKDGSMIVTNRTIYYQIVNGKNTYGTANVTLEDGNYSIYYTPTKYGFETSTVTYQGARFFAPSNSRRIAKILRRPLNLTFIDYWHNNPNRPDVKHSGHRGEIITIVARIQDYLNGSNLKNQIVDFGYYIHHFRDIIRYLDISNKSDNNGWVYINVKLNVTNKLIQAGNYQLRLKIKMNDYYQPIEVSHQDRLRIFEIGHIGINIGAISMEDMNYVMKPTICLYDEDNRVVRNVEFYIQLLEMRTNQVAHDQYMSSGRVEIAIMNAGLYEIRVSIADEDIAELLNIQEIASYFNQSLYVFLLTKVANILVSDDYVPYIYIPIISDVLYFALEYAVKWKAGIYSFLLLLVLNIFSGYIGEYVGLTWMDLLKLILFTAFCGLFEYSRWFLYGFLRMYEEDVDDYWLLLSVSKLINSLKSPSWFIVAISLIAIDLILIQFNFREFKLDIDLNVEVILIELLILFIAGLIEFIFHNLPSILEPLRRGLIYLGKRIWDTFHKYKEYHEKLISVLPIASYIIFIISDALIGFVIDLIFDLIPKPDDPFLAFLIDIARLALKYSLIIGVNVVISIYGGGPSNIAAQAIKEAVKQVIKKVVEKLIIDMLSKVLFDFLFDIIIPI